MEENELTHESTSTMQYDLQSLIESLEEQVRKKKNS